jgi:exopolyphosphatase/guanosine-5'-triphosphate,3'-diphosphate pyrophosphatase
MEINLKKNWKLRQVISPLQNDLEHFAAIDLGTNSCRLLIVTKTPGGFKIVFAFSRMVRLGEDLDKHKRILETSMNRAILALKFCAEKMSEFNVVRYTALATAACRMADNRDEFIQRIFEEAGIKVEVIDELTEAELSLLGCSGLLKPQKPYGIVFDIGGGSTEVIWVDNCVENSPQIIDYVSVPIGVIHHDLNQMTAQTILAPMAHRIQELSAANNIQRYIEQDQVQLIGTSGTVTTLAAIDMNLKKYDRKYIDGIIIPTDRILSVIKHLYQMTHEDMLTHACIGHHRADLIIPGAEIFQCIHRFCPVKSLTIADRGVREGIVMKMLQSST